MLRYWVIGVLCMLAVGGVAQAQVTVHVDGDNPCPGTGTVIDPFCRIQDAICAVRTTPPATVLVHPKTADGGVYNEAIRMFSGVSVISTDGPAATTISASSPAVKACITSTCTVSALTPCATVYFPSASPASNADRLEGFRITGGKGLNQTCGGGCSFQSGGGIYIFGSSPTITMNEIVGNVLAPGSGNGAPTHLKGGGIYMQAGIGANPVSPVITSNLIEGNVANAVAGAGPVATRYSMGGGIYVGDTAEPTIADNTIRDNLSGTVKSRHRGGGGGIAVYALVQYGAQPVITRNLIQSNDASECGGGVSLSYGLYAPSDALVENNLIEMNGSPTAGGGVWTGGTRAKIRSNTITDNTAPNGGGILAGISLGVDQITVVNNLVTFNTSSVSGGGLNVQPLAEGQAVPTVRFTDLYGNTPQNVGGAKVDADYINMDGNVSVDPLYIDRVDPDRDYRLQASSPVIDEGDSAEASALDLDGNARVQGAAIDLGAWEFAAILDSDGDGDPDSTDPDDDNDGVPDVSDCAALAAGVSQPPDPVGNTLTLDKTGGGRLRWLRSFQGHTYNVYRGTFVNGQPWSYNEVCLVSEVTASLHVDPNTPVNPGDGFYYLVAARNGCGDAVAGFDGPDENPIVPAAACSLLGLNHDADALTDVMDNCPVDTNSTQGDQDADFVGNACDNCLTAWNPGQGDPDADARGDACDNCPVVANASQEDGDVDQVGDLCDNCPAVQNPGQGDADVDTQGDDCDLCTDTDGDTFGNPGFLANTCATDNCPVAPNPGQDDFEMDGQGDVCDADDDNDLVDDGLDCAPQDASASSPPQEVANLSVNQPGTTLGWSDQGLGFRYDVAGGLISDLIAQQATTSAVCIQNDVSGSSFADGRPDPSIGDGYFYMLRSQNACGTGTYGFATLGQERFAGTDCP